MRKIVEAVILVSLVISVLFTASCSQNTDSASTDNEEGKSESDLPEGPDANPDENPGGDTVDTPDTPTPDTPTPDIPTPDIPTPDTPTPDTPTPDTPTPDTPTPDTPTPDTPTPDTPTPDTPTPDTPVTPPESDTPTDTPETDSPTNPNPTYTVLFDLSYGDMSFSMTTEGILTKPLDPIRENYNFIGWYNGSEPWDFNSVVSIENLTLRAVWEIKKYKINYFLDEGVDNSLNPRFYTAESPIVLNDPVKSGAYFCGWYSNSDFTVPFSLPSELSDVSLYPKFVEISQNLTFTKVDGGYFVTGYDGNEISFGIPESYLGESVIGIDLKVFEKSDIENLIIPDSVTRVLSSGALNLKDKFYIKEGNAYYVGNYKNPYKILAGVRDNEIEELTIHSLTEIIADGAFCDFYTLKEIKGGESVKYIGNSAFENSSSLIKISVLNNALIIGDKAFFSCKNLQDFNFSEKLLSIGEDAFAYCEKLTMIKLPATVLNVSNNAFFSCENLVGIVLTEGIKAVSANSFDNASIDFKLYYTGSEETFAKLNLDSLKSRVYFYSLTLPQDSGKYWHYDLNQIKIWETK